MTRPPILRTVDRPWTVATALLTAAHHGFELSSGVGLVLQPELGLVPAGLLWGAEIPLWIVLAIRGRGRWDRLLAAASGVALAGAFVHFLLWPWRRGHWGLPVLTQAEGLRSEHLPAYSSLLYAWGTAAALSVVAEVAPGRRRWALIGLPLLPLLHRSARHHFSWLTEVAVTDPRWWNRGVRRSDVSPSGRRPAG